MAAANTGDRKWFPLESNPSLINEYVERMGFNTQLYHFVDVFSTDDWALEIIPQPVAAVVVLYPLTEKQLEGETEGDLVAAKSTNVWFMKQRIRNACGTIGVLHSILNTPTSDSRCRKDSWIFRFQESCPIDLDPLSKAETLEKDSTIASLHDAAASSDQNQTPRGSVDERVETHFMALVVQGGILYELDGRKPGPIVHGASSPATLLKDACKVVQTLMARDPGEIRFTILALAPNQS